MIMNQRGDLFHTLPDGALVQELSKDECELTSNTAATATCKNAKKKCKQKRLQKKEQEEKE